MEIESNIYNEQNGEFEWCKKLNHIVDPPTCWAYVKDKTGINMGAADPTG